MIGVVGNTHLALVNAAVIATHGQGRDVRLFTRGLAMDGNGEPGLDDLLTKAITSGRLTVAESWGMLAGCDLIFVAVDVADHNDDAEITRLRVLLDQVADDRSPSANVVILSQVPPGFTRSIKRIPDHKLFCMVDTLIFGTAIHRARTAHHAVIGGATPYAKGDYSNPTLPGHMYPIYRVTYEDAEVTKLAINCYLAAQITMTNSLAHVASGVGASWHRIGLALAGDPRIGKYVKPGIGIGGGHLMRDVYSAGNLSDWYRRGAFDAISQGAKEDQWWIMWQVKAAIPANLPPRHIVGVWGAAYKVGTNSVEGSLRKSLIREFYNERYVFSVHDPVVKLSDHVWFMSEGSKVEQAKTPLDAANGVSCLVIATPWPDYAQVHLGDLREVMAANPVIIDPYGLLQHYKVARAGFRHVVLGEKFNDAGDQSADEPAEDEAERPSSRAG